MGQIKNIKLHIVTEIKPFNLTKTKTTNKRMATGGSLLRTVCHLNKLFLPITSRRCAPILPSSTTRNIFSKSKGTETTDKTAAEATSETSDAAAEKLAAIVAEKTSS